MSVGCCQDRNVIWIQVVVSVLRILTFNGYWELQILVLFENFRSFMLLNSTQDDIVL